jgi:tetratricopeptide (TPR) repeat protein
MYASFRDVLATSCLLALLNASPALGQGDDEARRLFHQAQALAKEEKFDEAVTAMKKAVELAPRNDHYFAILSEFERHADRPADATEHALQAIRLNDKMAIYYALVAADAFANQDLDLSREYCQTALKRGEQALGAGAYQDMKVLDGFLSKRTITITWNLNPQKGTPTAGAFTVALPKTDLLYQSVSYTVAGARSHQRVQQEANDLLRIVPDGINPVKLTTRITTLPFSYKKRLAKRARGMWPRDARDYLRSVDDINANSAKVTRIVARLRGKDDLETVQNILAWMKKHIHYKFEGKSVWGLDYKSVDEIVERGHAECRGYTITFVALCRAANVPARPVWGFAMIPPTKAAPKGDYGSHNWAEVYISGVGWVPVDAQKPETLGCLPNNSLRIFMFTRRSLSTPENLPLLNLLSMNGDKVQWEEMR